MGSSQEVILQLSQAELWELSRAGSPGGLGSLRPMAGMGKLEWGICTPALEQGLTVLVWAGGGSWAREDRREAQVGWS